MTSATSLLANGLLIWLLILGGLIGLRLLTGEINTRGLFTSNQAAAGRGIDAERVQAAVILPLVLGGYVLNALKGGAVPTESGGLALPDVPENLLALMVGSQGFYLLGKMKRVIWDGSAVARLARLVAERETLESERKE